MGLAPDSRAAALKWNELVQRDMEDARNISEWERDDLSRSSNRRYFRQWRHRMGIKIGKIQTREYMSRLEISDKVLVLCFKAEPVFSTIFNIERVSTCEPSVT